MNSSEPDLKSSRVAESKSNYSWLRLVLGITLLPALLFAIVNLSVGLAVDGNGNIKQIQGFLLSSSSFIVAALLYLLITGKIKETLSFLKLKSFHWIHVVVGLGAAAATYSLAILVGMITALLVTQSGGGEEAMGQNSTTETINSLTQSSSIVFLGFMIALLAPIGEELFFRGAMLGSMIQDSTKKWVRVLSVVLISIVFGLFHMQTPTGTAADFTAVIVPGLVGLTSGLTVLMYNSLYPAIFTHVFYNAAVLMIIAYGG